MKSKSILQEMADEDAVSALKTVKNYCHQMKDCDECSIKSICDKYFYESHGFDVPSIAPESWEIE